MPLLNRPKSLTELVTEKLRELIVDGTLALGSNLSEASIAKDLGVSRTPVREAVNRLEMEGLLRIEPQRGTFVFSLEPEELAMICDARVCLETTAMTEAISRNPETLQAALADCVAQMKTARQKADDQGYLALDTHFHQCILDHSGNRFLNDAYQTISFKMAAIRNRLGRHPDHMAKSFREHCEMLETVKNRDVEKALRILEAHIGRKEGSYWDFATGGEDSGFSLAPAV